jgi:hypothetical protein
MLGVCFIERGVRTRDAVQLIEQARAFRRITRESVRYALDRLNHQTVADLVPLLDDVATVTNCAPAPLESGQLRTAVWVAVHRLAGEIESVAVGSDGQMLRCADRTASFSGAWSTVVERPGETSPAVCRSPLAGTGRDRLR